MWSGPITAKHPGNTRYNRIVGWMSKARFYCPECGFADTPDAKTLNQLFRYLEDITNWRQIEGFDSGSRTLNIKGLYHTGEGYEEGKNARIECGNCLHEFKVPESWTEEFH